MEFSVRVVEFSAKFFFPAFMGAPMLSSFTHQDLSFWQICFAGLLGGLVSLPVESVLLKRIGKRLFGRWA